MQITLDTGTAGEHELTALIALLASLGGRLPNHSTVTNQVNIEHCGPTPTPPVTIAEIAKTTPDEPARARPADEPPDQAVDSKGTPWDARIHSESKATVADGTWRKRRGVSDELFNEVMAELTSDTAPPPPPADDEDEEVPLAPADESVPAPPAPTADAPSEPEPAVSAPAAGDGQFPDFPSFVAAVAKHGKTYAELNEMAGVVGVAAFKDLKGHADKWDMFFSMIG